MERVLVEDKRFDKLVFADKPLEKGEYENCEFHHCDLSNANLSDIDFMDCEFNHCNLSMVKLTKTAFKTVRFTSCKVLGLHFEDCTDFLFSVNFYDCDVKISSFYNVKMKKSIFSNCTMHEVDFTNADLSNSVFDNCDLLHSIFDETIVEKADFRTAFNYSINPQTNRIKKAKFSREGVAGLLQQYDIIIE